MVGVLGSMSAAAMGRSVSDEGEIVGGGGVKIAYADYQSSEKVVSFFGPVNGTQKSQKKN